MGSNQRNGKERQNSITKNEREDNENATPNAAAHQYREVERGHLSTERRPGEEGLRMAFTGVGARSSARAKTTATSANKPPGKKVEGTHTSMNGTMSRPQHNAQFNTQKAAG